jgi:flagellin
LQSANGSNSAVDRESLDTEVAALKLELTRIAETTSFGGQQLLDGSFGSKSFQVGANANEVISMSLTDISADAIGSARTDLAGDSAGLGQVTAAGAGTTTIPNGVTAGTLEILGNNATAETVNISLSDSAATIANNINNVTNSTGVSAQANTTAELKMGNNAGAVSFSLNGDSVTFDTTGVTNDGDALNTAISAINGAGTAVTASLNDAGDGILLNAADGSDIQIVDFASDSGNATVEAFNYDGASKGLSPITIGASGADDSVTVGGTIRLDSTSAFSTTSSVDTISADTTATNSGFIGVDSVNITTQGGSQDALAVIDAALAQIDNERADLGALQNRFSYTISNLANVQENVSASRSRIQDTDFAVETAQMTKNQILQQAGTSILAQANQLPQAALSLIG